jgi:hypothetical protein
MLRGLDKEHSTNQHSCSSDPTYSDFRLPGAVAQLSNPKIEHEIPFPFISVGTPNRFTLDEKHRWRYTGREKFAELLSELRLVQKETKYKRLWVYGTRGYGKSHLLAALVCYLAALGKRVIYIPGCRSCLENPVDYLRKAMLFAWTDKATQDEILTLNTKEKIQNFLGRQRKVLFVIDQMNELSEVKTKRGTKYKQEKLLTWIYTLISSHKAVVTSSANFQEYLKRQISQNYDRTMDVYGGLTKVCLNIG